MPKSVEDILHENQIEIGSRGFANNKASAVCPQCSPFRKKRNSRCLQVYLHPTGVTFHCYHCEWKGGGFFDDHPQRRNDERSRRRIEQRPSSYSRSPYR